MKRSELGAILVGAFLGTVVAIVILAWAHVFASSDYSNGASNLLGIIGTVPLIAGLGVAAWTRWHRSCAVPYCLRIGEHPVKGTRSKVCRKHHTVKHHEIVHALHWTEEQLAWGESHDREGAPPE